MNCFRDYRSVNAVDALLFEGGEVPGSWPEELILKVRLEAVLGQIEMLLDRREINSVSLITDYEILKGIVKSHPEYKKRLNLIDTSSMNKGVLKEDAFHFGKTLKYIINERSLQKVLICGGGSTPLLSKEEVSHVCKKLMDADDLLFTNNPQSGDLVAFTPASAINYMDPPTSDNALVMGLRYDVGLNFDLIPFSTGVLFDIDTPTELYFLWEHPLTKERTKNIIDNLDPDEKKIIKDGLKRFSEVKDVLSGYYEDVVLIGRVSGSMITHINENIKIRLRVFSEERGMKAMGRVEAGKVKSLIGYFIEDMGIDRFFGYLETLGRAVVMDSRVIFHHFGAGDKTSDRFYSDLFMPEKIENDFIRKFTLRAKDAEVPILLGGHSLVSGGIYSLVEQLK